MLRQEEAAGQVLGVLLGVDAVRVLLPVEPTPVQATSAGVAPSASMSLRLLCSA